MKVPFHKIHIKGFSGQCIDLHYELTLSDFLSPGEIRRLELDGIYRVLSSGLIKRGIQPPNYWEVFDKFEPHLNSLTGSEHLPF